MSVRVIAEQENTTISIEEFLSGRTYLTIGALSLGHGGRVLSFPLKTSEKDNENLDKLIEALQELRRDFD